MRVETKEGNVFVLGIFVPSKNQEVSLAGRVPIPGGRGTLWIIEISCANLLCKYDNNGVTEALSQQAHQGI